MSNCWHFEENTRLFINLNCKQQKKGNKPPTNELSMLNRRWAGWDHLLMFTLATCHQLNKNIVHLLQPGGISQNHHKEITIISITILTFSEPPTTSIRHYEIRHPPCNHFIIKSSCMQMMFYYTSQTLNLVFCWSTIWILHTAECLAFPETRYHLTFGVNADLRGKLQIKCLNVSPNIKNIIFTFLLLLIINSNSTWFVSSKKMKNNLERLT